MLNPRIADRLIHKPTPLRNGLYFDVMDGSYFALDMYLQTKKNCLQLLMFQDAIKICNPLGSRRTKHKSVMFYVKLAKCSPQLRSKLSSIKLLSCISNKLLQKMVSSLCCGKVITVLGRHTWTTLNLWSQNWNRLGLPKV